VPGLGTSFGRGGATTFQQDLQNSDCIVIQGSNMAECHPVGFQWVMEAKRRGATIIHVDPRFTRTSSMADIHVPLRPGTDVAFLGGIVNYIIEHNRYFEEYVVKYTNAPCIISKDFKDTDDLDGLYSGWDPEKGRYNSASWQYEGLDVTAAAGEREMFAGESETKQRGGDVMSEKVDETLQDPNCVFQILRRHFSRYTPETVEAICGVKKRLFIRVAEELCRNSGRDRTSAFCYAVGWTQHSIGVQYIRTAAIIQLLLGNIGRPGGGILALRGHASIQGSTDIPTLYNLLPGYIAMPKASHDVNLEKYIEGNRSSSGWWSEFPKYFVSLMKAYFGDAARKESNWCFDYLPHISGDHSHMWTVSRMADGGVNGYFVMGENPVVGSMHGALHRKGLRELDWLVVRDFAVTETADFWREAPEIQRCEVRPEDIKTEVFFFPCAAHTEKAGTFTNTQRLLQWHHKAIDPPGNCRSDLHFVYHLGLRLKELYSGSPDKKDRPIQDLMWRYPKLPPHDEPDAEAVLKEINGYKISNDEPVPSYKELKDDGSTVCGCWIYCGVYKNDVNQAARRKPGWEQPWVAPEWGWAWPANRHLIYNRASADPLGKPWSERKRYVWWDDAQQKWDGFDNPDFIDSRPPHYKPDKHAAGLDTIAGDKPFMMQADSRAWIFAPSGLTDGPLPAHYEPQESIIQNPLYGQHANPARMEWLREDNPYHRAWDDPRFPYVITTYRLTEHHTAGSMTRWLSWLSELQPAFFCEVSPELAAERGLQNGGWATITTARAELEARVLVTRRLFPLRIKGRVFHQIGLPYHWGSKGLSRGDTANELISFVADPNVSIQESKAFTGDIRPGRRSSHKRVVTSGPFAAGASNGNRRDLPAVERKKVLSHGVRASKVIKE